MANRPETGEQFHAKFLRRAIEDIADGLKRLAVDVRAEASRVGKVGTAGTASYSAIAAAIQHEIAWKSANLHIERLTRDASQADIARAKGE